ncbi:MAG TPA: hypothetical protein VGO87_05330 [Acidimicrobiia bacterium]|jgi:hypothetical protein
MAVDRELELKKQQLLTAEAERRLQTAKLLKAARDLKKAIKDIPRTKDRAEKAKVKKDALLHSSNKKTATSNIKIQDERIRTLRRQIREAGRY